MACTSCTRASSRWTTCSTIADVSTLHVPLTDETHHLVGERELGLMKPTAYLVNTSRGPVVDEAALRATLCARAVSRALRSTSSSASRTSSKAARARQRRPHAAHRVGDARGAGGDGHALRESPPRGVASVTMRAAESSDAAAIAQIYNEGIEDRLATFETEPRTAEDIASVARGGRFRSSSSSRTARSSPGPSLTGTATARPTPESASSRSTSRERRVAGDSVEQRCRA